MLVNFTEVKAVLQNKLAELIQINCHHYNTRNRDVLLGFQDVASHCSVRMKQSMHAYVCCLKGLILSDDLQA